MSTFFGTNAADTVVFGDGFQFVFGFGGDDTLSSGGAAYCEIFGGDGNDHLDLVTPGFGKADGGPGNDIIDGSNSADEIYGGSGNDIITSTAQGAANDFVDGGSGNDTISAGGLVYGGAGNDIITTNSGFDRIFGGTGHDVINASTGADIIVGGRGQDDLTGGGAEQDIFRYTSARDSLRGSARDIIHDFDAADIIDLSAIDANTHKSGNQQFHFIGGASFDHTRGALRFAGTLLSGDVDGDGRADFQIELLGVAPVEAQFVL